MQDWIKSIPRGNKIYAPIDQKLLQPGLETIDFPWQDPVDLIIAASYFNSF